MTLPNRPGYVVHRAGTPRDNNNNQQSTTNNNNNNTPNTSINNVNAQHNNVTVNTIPQEPFHTQATVQQDLLARTNDNRSLARFFEDEDTSLSVLDNAALNNAAQPNTAEISERLPFLTEKISNDDLQARKQFIVNHILFPTVLDILNECRKDGLLGHLGQYHGEDELLDSFNIDEFLQSQGIDLKTNNIRKSQGESSDEGLDFDKAAGNQLQAEFIAKIEGMKKRYEEELVKINRVKDDFANKLLTLLRESTIIRPIIPNNEVELKLAAIKAKFNVLKTQLKQNVCNAILVLQKQYNQSKRKRRSLSKKATEVLNNWFFDHIKDPYPSDEEKTLLASQCFLTLNQINNWFGNKRIRYKRKCWEEHRRRKEAGDIDCNDLPSLPEPKYLKQAIKRKNNNININTNNNNTNPATTVNNNGHVGDQVVDMGLSNSPIL